MVSEALFVVGELLLLAVGFQALAALAKGEQPIVRLLPLARKGARGLSYPQAFPVALVSWLTVPLLMRLLAKPTETQAEALWALALAAVTTNTAAAVLGFWKMKRQQGGGSTAS